MSLNQCGSCSVGPNQEPASSVAGNIGTVRAKVEIWENDPFYARGHQTYSFPFSRLVPEQLADDVPGIEWAIDSAYLKPIYEPQDMYICTYNPDLKDTFVNPSPDEQEYTVHDKLDFVGAASCIYGKIASDRLPGGFTYNTQLVPFEGEGPPYLDELTGRDIFPHQVWLHIGNIFKRGVPKHPSEYDARLDDIQAAKGYTADGDESQSFSLDEIIGATMWDYTDEVEEGRRRYSPYMIVKQPIGRNVPVHWSLEKFTPVFQGEDFFITVYIRKQVDESEDTNPVGEFIGSWWDEYKYLMYDVENPPAGWVKGLSNAAFHVPVKRDKTGAISEAAQKEAEDTARKVYWWKHKAYILIEIGAGNAEHNYFIEIVKGRKPRFLHLGEEWDNPKRMTSGSEITADDPEWGWYRKCRVLSEYAGLSCNELFRKEEFRITVRNHLGRMMIIFQGYEDNPWVVSRQDFDPLRKDFTKRLMPMVVPPSKIRVHGGNVSCAINFSPLKYISSETVPFRDRQADTGPSPGDFDRTALYMTFAHMGGSSLYKNPVSMRRIFTDRRLDSKKGTVTYDCDAYIANGIIGGRRITGKDARTGALTTGIRIYEEFYNQYRSYGKGWLWSHQKDKFGEYQRDATTKLIRPPIALNGMSAKEGGVESELKIVNLTNESQPFRFGLRGQHANYPYKGYVSKWDVGIQFRAGSVNMPVPKAKFTSGSADRQNDIDQKTAIMIDETAEQYLYKDYVTPIATSWRLIILGGEKPTRTSSGRPKVQPFDVACLTEKISDGWSAEGYSNLKHESKITCYIPVGVPMDNQEIYRLGQRLKDLHNKAFYVTLSYWWDDGIGERDAPNNSISRRSPENNDLLIQMTGIAYGGTLRKSVNKLYMDFTVKDYMSVFEKQFIFNSPYFDGVDDVRAVYELARLAGFDYDDRPSSRVNRQPLGYLQHVIKNGDRLGNGLFRYNGEQSRCRSYDLPGSYATLQQPAVRFTNGEKFDVALRKVADLASKIVYFDRWGVLRLENIPAIDAAFQSGEQLDFEPVFDFVTSPFPFKKSDGIVSTTASPFTFDPCDHASHLVYNVVQYTRSVEDCVNQIVLLTASNDILLPSGDRADGGLIVEGYTFFDQIWNPEEEGFLGYRKPFYQSNGVFGGIEGVRRGLAHYAKMKYPPATISFETYGVPGLKGLDIITLDGNLFYITEINHEIDPKTNRWWMTINGEWLKPFSGDLGFLKEREAPSDESTEDQTEDT